MAGPDCGFAPERNATAGGNKALVVAALVVSPLMYIAGRAVTALRGELLV
jgi:hypothetical protein